MTSLFFFFISTSADSYIGLNSSSKFNKISSCSGYFHSMASKAFEFLFFIFLYSFIHLIKSSYSLSFKFNISSQNISYGLSKRALFSFGSFDLLFFCFGFMLFINSSNDFFMKFSQISDIFSISSGVHFSWINCFSKIRFKIIFAVLL